MHKELVWVKDKDNVDLFLRFGNVGNFWAPPKARVLRVRFKILASTDILVLGFYRYIGGYFYMNIDISKINKNTLKFIEILCKSVKITIIIKYTH